MPVEEVVQDLNRFLRGCAGYFRYGHSAARFHNITQHARDRLALFIGKRHKHRPSFGRSVVAPKSTEFCGLLNPNGTVIAPRANKPWRDKPNADGERRR
ncbi:group II intron maturase-specific domain-containing protein [Mycobacterium riyadhense]|uniref:group II intron maturase-specific domain-containing protein n=1 Tax=Mycobacterium riyadhense TaxID=486698 RepID=UPI0035566719